MPIFDQDIYGQQNIIELVIRFHEKAITEFDKSNSISYQALNQEINGKEMNCYFQKNTNTEHKCIIPLENSGGQIELVCEWEEREFLYRIRVNKKKKTKHLNTIDLPENQYLINEKCKIKFIGNEPCRTKPELEELKNRIDKLEIPPKTKIENERDIWTKYIQAQELIIKKLQEPFDCTGKYKLSEQKNDKGEISRFRFEVELVTEKNDEYSKIQKRLSEEPFNIQYQIPNEKGEIEFVKPIFNVDGNIELNYDDIANKLDILIQQEYQEIIERENRLSCILLIRPFSSLQQLKNDLISLNWNVNIQGQYNSDELFAFSFSKIEDEGNGEKIQSNLSEIRFPKEIVEKYALYRKGIISKLRLIDNKDNDTYKEIRFDFKRPVWGENLERKKNEIKQNLIQKRQELFDKGNYKSIKFQIGEIYSYVNKTKENNSFTDIFWQDLKLELYKLDFKVEVGDNNTLYFEFTDRTDLLEKYEKLQAIGKFEIVKSPLDADFRFKVKTNLIAKKNQKQLFAEKISKLRSVDFVVEKEVKEKKYPERIFIGKLNANESTQNQLVFSIPHFWKDDKKIAKDFLKFIENEPKITKVQANLRGDETKTVWLKEAISKIINPTEKPNGKPVNENIKDFIFDSSKAKTIHKFDLKNIEETEEYKNSHKYEILQLNEPQRKAVLKALYAVDLALLQGPPGTGKTTVIAELIWQHIRNNQTQKLLLTSETNLAVDNALEKLMNTRNINPELARFISLIKPLRFGKPKKFEEEGRKYSVERILKWIDSEQLLQDEYEEEQLSEEVDEDEEIKENPNNNIIQNWMINIANRSSKSEKYANVLKDWQIELSMPDKQTKEYFKEKYFKNVNVVGSTCSSTGSNAFAKDYFQILYRDNYKAIEELKFLFEKKPDAYKVNEILQNFGYENFDNIEKMEIIKNLLSVKFDTVIMDEASKSTPPELLLPLTFGKKSVVIGDHRQLPPLLNEKDFKETLQDLNDPRANQLIEEINREFVETSQFERLILNPKVSHTVKSTFNIQYRMHPKINEVIEQFYADEGGLICGLDINKVDIQDLNEPQSRYHGFAHEGFINPDIHTIWVNVDAPEMQDGTSRVNETEVAVIKQVLSYLKNSQGFEEFFKYWNKIKDEEKRLQEQEIGIISFYGKQLGKLREARDYGRKLGLPIRLKTVDKFQGMERNIIIVSTVRSDKLDKGNGKIERNYDIGFAKSPQRLNVALSRARRLLIVVGNKDFFYKSNPIYKNAIDKMQRIIDFKELKNITK
jgi:superfamily I DNA and/or RNA helicase